MAAWDKTIISAGGATTSGAVASTTLAVFDTPLFVRGLICILDVTAAATDIIDTLDVSVQTLIDGTNWTQICHFTQVLGNGGAKRHIGVINSHVVQAMWESSAALAAGSVRHVMGNQLRVEYVTVDADANSAFTFTVKVMPF